MCHIISTSHLCVLVTKYRISKFWMSLSVANIDFVEQHVLLWHVSGLIMSLAQLLPSQESTIKHPAKPLKVLHGLQTNHVLLHINIIYNTLDYISYIHAWSQIPKDFKSTPIRHLSNVEVLNLCLINTNPRVSAIWIHNRSISCQSTSIAHYLFKSILQCMG